MRKRSPGDAGFRDGTATVACRSPRGVTAAGVAETLLHVAVGDHCELVAERFDRTERSQAGVRPAAVEGDVLVDERIQELARIAGEGAGRDEMVGEGTLLVEHPGVHRRDELLGADEVHLHGENAEEEISIGGGAGHGGDRVTGMQWDGGETILACRRRSRRGKTQGTAADCEAKSPCGNLWLPLEHLAIGEQTFTELRVGDVLHCAVSVDRQ